MLIFLYFFYSDWLFLEFTLSVRRYIWYCTSYFENFSPVNLNPPPSPGQVRDFILYKFKIWPRTENLTKQKKSSSLLSHNAVFISLILPLFRFFRNRMSFCFSFIYGQIVLFNLMIIVKQNKIYYEILIKNSTNCYHN